MNTLLLLGALAVVAGSQSKNRKVTPTNTATIGPAPQAPPPSTEELISTFGGEVLGNLEQWLYATPNAPPSYPPSSQAGYAGKEYTGTSVGTDTYNSGADSQSNLAGKWNKL